MTGPNVSTLGPRLLRGSVVTLEALEDRHQDELRLAADSPDIFRYMPTPDFESWFAKARADAARSDRICFIVRRTDTGTAIGSTSYFDNSPKDGRVEIGSTWYSATAQGTLVNPAAKYLLLTNAFDAGYNCVMFRTDARNARSRAAILKLGARQDGILRANVWMPQGYFRDSVFFSVLAAEWPVVRAGLEQRLAT